FSSSYFLLTPASSSSSSLTTFSAIVTGVDTDGDAHLARVPLSGSLLLDKFTRLLDRSKESPKAVKQLTRLFPNWVCQYNFLRFSTKLDWNVLNLRLSASKIKL
ncbi:hypothetical protein HN51_039139, partial [Arachis hypogaea]